MHTIRILLTLSLLFGGVATPILADGLGEPPLLTAGQPYSTQIMATIQLNGPGDPPLCFPGEPRCPIN